MKNRILLLFVIASLMACSVFAGDFKIQHPAGTDLFVVDTAGNLNLTTGNLNVSSGTIAENGILLSDIYWAIVDVATPSSGDTTHLSTADQIFDYIAGLDYTTTTYLAGQIDGLVNLTVAEVITMIDGSGNFTAWGYNYDDMVNTPTNLINFSDGVGYFSDIENFTGTLTNGKTCIYSSGNTELICDTTPTTGTVTSVSTTAPIAGGEITGSGTISLTACADTEIYKYNSTAGAWECETDSGGLDAVVDDPSPELGGFLDTNGNAISDSARTANITVSASGVIIVI